MAKIPSVTDDTFEADVLKSDLPTLVDFNAPWCGPCRMISPLVEELSAEYEGKVNFLSMNTDENPEWPGRYGVRGLPTLLVFKGGEVAGTIVGFRPKSDLKRRLDAALA